MNKLRLRLDDLVIDSFGTTPVRKGNGTVYGEQCTCPTACTCPGCPTCDASCGGTCGASCNGTCTCPNTYDISCGGTCEESCDTCAYTCQGYQTAGSIYMDCVIC